MNLIFASFILFSVLSAILSGQTAQLTVSIPEGASAAVTLALSLAGPMCLWSGVAHAMEQCGWMDGLTRLFAPLLKRLFPRAWADREAREALCGNVSANLLGVGNAATPLGLRAVQRMALGSNGRASDELCRLVVMNTASIQLIPSTVAAVRSGLGSAAPFDILPAVWLTSLCSVSVGLLAAKVLSKWL